MIFFVFSFQDLHQTKASGFQHMIIECQQLGFKLFLLPQANGHACVDFGCTHPIDGLF
jgi:hypothetical protein